MISDPRSEALFRERYDANMRRVDRVFGWLMVAQWLFAIGLALWFSPYAWEGRARHVHVHVYLAIFLGLAISGVPIVLVIFRPGWVVTRHVVAIAQMLWSALLIHLSGGRIETHFHVFGSLAFLAFYRDWRVLVPATLVVVIDHLARQLWWPESVYGLSSPEWWRFLEHAFWVVFEDIILVIGCLTSVTEMKHIARQQVSVEATQRAAREMEIASTIQTSILPRTVEVPGLEAAALMVPAEQVGGDYYDVLPVDGGCWIAIGDVAGHGVRAGLSMMQAQSALAALVRHDPQARPAALWAGLNHTFFDNVRQRRRHDDHMTFSLLRYHDDGRFEAIGAHEEILLWREARGDCEVLPMQGTWVGLTTAPRPDDEVQRFRLAPGDLLVLYTDGIIEARGPDGRELGLDAVRDVIRRCHAGAVDRIRDEIFAIAGATRRHDDASVLVFRYVGRERTSAIQQAARSPAA